MTSNPPSRPPAAENRWIWPFELLDKVGEGGMGVVYRARYVVDNRHVAVKLLPPNIANETILSRFERELEILKTLRHPNIVRCFGGVCEGNQHFYAMELVEGGTLDRMLEERGKFPWETVVQMALQMTSGLSYAHERGVVHRDVKPGNFLITPNGKLKLSDFGLATVVAAAKITAAGKTMGTFPYMAPEQIRGRPPVTAQTDLYALGCVMFEMLTGRTPFVGDAPAEVMHKHLDALPPRVAEFAVDCPPALESLVRDLLQKEPADRPESAYVVAQRLMEVTELVEVTPSKTRLTDATPTAPRMAVPAGQLPRIAQPAARNKWLIPALGALLIISLALNVRGLFSSPAKNTADELWIKAFHSGRPEIEQEAAKALGELAPHSAPALDALVAALSDPRPFVRDLAIDGLVASGDTGRNAVPELLRIQKADENDQVRRKAAVALKAIQESPQQSAGSWSALYWIVMLVIAAAVLFAIVMARAAARTPRGTR